MKYSPIIRTAMSIAYIAHAGQFDKGGYPYIHHPLHLAEQMSDEYSCAAALLHDVVEDGNGFSLNELRLNGIPEPVVEAVGLLTREPGTPYLDYVRKLSSNTIARAVKLADLRHNLDCSRLGDNEDGAVEQRLVRYVKAIRILEDAEEQVAQNCAIIPHDPNLSRSVCEELGIDWHDDSTP